ncbi:hypothetical protein EV426DRAFT_105625 [Tirmania nivea]|nr:hypothetical protein EV426DRAFT_105625 [Tirmania nivea]
MGTGWRTLEIDDNSGERPAAPILQNSVNRRNRRNGQIDGAFEPGNMHSREESGTTEAKGASPKFGRYGKLGKFATGPVLRGGKLSMSSIRDNRESTSPQILQSQFIHGRYQIITSTPHTGPPGRRCPPISIDWGTLKWSSLDTATPKSRSNVHFKSEEKRLSEDLPQLSPQVSPRTVPSSTLWQHTLQVDINMPMGTTTYESPRSPPLRCSSLEQNRNPELTNPKKSSTSRRRYNPKLRSRQAPRRTSSLDFACRGSIAKISVFSEDIDLGVKKRQPDTTTTCSSGNTIRKKRKAVSRALASTGLIGWRNRERDDKEEGRAWKEGSIHHKLGRTWESKPSEYSYPSAPPSPHPGNRGYILGSSSTGSRGASVAMSVRRTREVQAAEAADDGAEVEAKLKRKRITDFMKLMGR